MEPCLFLNPRIVTYRYGRGRTGHERHARGNLVDGDPDGDALRQPYPRVDRVNAGKTLSAVVALDTLTPRVIVVTCPLIGIE
jgi:hypothetical protein